MGRTLQIVTAGKEELVCFVQKSAKALIMEVRQSFKAAAVHATLSGMFQIGFGTGRFQGWLASTFTYMTPTRSSSGGSQHGQRHKVSGYPGPYPAKATWSAHCDMTLNVQLQAALGSGSEMVIDVAPGVDWTAMIAILMAVQQVGRPDCNTHTHPALHTCTPARARVVLFATSSHGVCAC